MLHYYHINWFLNIVSKDYRGSENLPSFILLFYCSEIIWFLNIPLSRDCNILYTALISLFYSSFIILYLNIFHSVDMRPWQYPPLAVALPPFFSLASSISLRASLLVSSIFSQTSSNSSFLKWNKIWNIFFFKCQN